MQTNKGKYSVMTKEYGKSDNYSPSENMSSQENDLKRQRPLMKHEAVDSEENIPENCATPSTLADLPSTEIQPLFLSRSNLSPVENSDVFLWKDFKGKKSQDEVIGRFFR